jgi:hypothetical protein
VIKILIFVVMNLIFTYRGKEYKGDLSIVQGAGDTGVYHLTIDNTIEVAFDCLHMIIDGFSMVSSASCPSDLAGCCRQ